MKTLVVVYSETGNTLSVAKRIASKLNADLEVIEDKTNRKGILGFLRSGYEALKKKVPPIAEPKYNPDNYDLVVIGTPIWAGRMSSPVRAYLIHFHNHFCRVAFFTTSLTGSHRRAFAEMAELVSTKPLATVELTVSQVRKGKETGSFKAFIKALKSQR